MSKKFSRSELIRALCGSEVWAIKPEWARSMASLASVPDFNPEALVTQVGEQFGTGMTRTSIRDGIGIMQVRGPLQTHEDFMSWVFGFDTYESIATDFEMLMNDSSVKGILLDFYSPGGMVAGASDLATMIYNARGLKPNGIVSRAGGEMASAAYWIGSSAERIYSADTAIIGSIGTLVQFQQDAADVVTIVSDLSPNKNPDPATLEGQAAVKGLLNKLTSIFVSSIARNRGVAEDAVLSDFGKGGVMVGQEAVDAGMVDTVATFDATFSDVAGANTTTTQERTMSGNPGQAAAPATNPQAAAPAVGAQAVAQDAVSQERKRITDIMGVFSGTPFAADAEGFIAEGKSLAEAQAYALQKFRAGASMVPAAKPGVTQQALAREGSMAAAASIPGAHGPDVEVDQSEILRKAMTAGANAHRSTGLRAVRNK